MLTLSVVAVSSVIVLAGSLLQRAVGFGVALLGVPLLAFVIATKSAVIVIFLIGSLTSLWVAVRLWSWIDWSMSRRLGAGAIAGAPVGVVVLAVVPAETLRLVLGLTTCAAALWILLSSRNVDTRPVVPGKTSTFAIGLVSGVVNTSLATNGPPLVYQLRRCGFRDNRFRATISAVFVVSNLVGLPLLATAGLISGADVALATTMLIPCLVGIAIGGWVGSRMNPAHFVLSVDLLLLATGILTIVKAMS